MNHEPISRATPGGDAADHRTGVGGLLRASRLRCGEELDAIAEVLRIRRRHLQAIEDGDFEQLPGTTYAVGFIRAYADYLGLDAEEVVRRFKEEQTTLQPGKPPKADLVFPSPMSESGIPRGAVVFLGVLIGVIAYGAWYSSTVDNDFFKKWIEPVPDRLASMLPGKAPEAAPDSRQAVAADKPAEATAPAGPAMNAAPADEAGSVQSQTEARTPAFAETQSDESRSGEMPVEAAPAAEVASTTEATPSNDAPSNVTSSNADPANEASPTAARPPESIAQPVETAELPAPEASTPEASTPEASAPAASSEQTVETTAPDTTAARPEPQAVADTATEAADAPEAAAPTAEAAATVAETVTASQATAEAVPEATTEATTDTAADTATEVASLPANAADARIILTAISDSWVEVRQMGTDTWVWGKLLRAGETYAVPDRPDLKMKTGNAGGLTITVDGASVPPVGASGDVVRNILLDPERLKAGTAVFR